MEITVIAASLEHTNNIQLYIADTEYKALDKVIVETPEGEKVAIVKKGNYSVEEESVSAENKVLRLVTEEDIKRIEENKEKAVNFRKETDKFIKKLNLDMKLVDVFVSFDATKAYFSYVSEDRVDFRELVKIMASTFKTRIELKQIGVRDEVKSIGGLGPCGRICCCKGHLTEFENVSIKMAKTQSLSLNPQKISGLCGRLMCCLAYENDMYKDLLKEMPKINSNVNTEFGTGVVSYIDIFKQKVSVKIEQENSTTIKEIPLEELKKLNKHLVDKNV